ncbi:MAG: hypothetical protein KDD70_14645 [Bdellovibrionales bacterium]|nr:hypothetical protein [Bdellovibrionales bacterium]
MHSKPFLVYSQVKLFWIISLCITALSLGSCTFTQDSELQSMLKAVEGSEPLALSEENEFLAPNQIVALLKQESTSIAGFLSKRGIPDAVRVTSSSTGNGEVEFYYLSPDELFKLKQSEATWVVLGPEAIQREFTVSLRRQVRQRVKEEEQRTTQTISDQNSTRTPVSPEIDEAPSPNFKGEVEALMEGQQIADADRNSRKDVLHRVVSSQETLTLISLWYTFQPDNASRIAGVNGKHIASQLNAGEEIVIPSYLVQNGSALTPGVLVGLTDILAGH